jgi:RHS repeat-associated protein
MQFLKVSIRMLNLSSTPVAMGRMLRRLVAGLFVIAIANVALAEEPIGLIEQQPYQAHSSADSSVTKQSGAFSTSVSLDAPGFQQVSPQLELSYSSSASNGFVGVGWTLGGFSTIERNSPGRGAPRFSNSWTADAYFLDGEELTPSNALGGNYSSLRQSYARITASADGQFWTVTQKNGLTQRYEPLVYSGTKVSKWALATQTDRHGNTATFRWVCEDAGGLNTDCYPSSITYANVTINVYRESRPDIETIGTGQSLGHQGHRLKSIDILVDGSRFRSYKLTYVASVRTGRSLLASVQEFGRTATVDGTGNVSGADALPAVSFTWSDAAVALAAAVTVSDQFGLSLGIWQGSDFHQADFNGDGSTDYLLVYTPSASSTTSSAYLVLSNGQGGYNSATDITNIPGASGQMWRNVRQAITSGDFNGDGRSDLFFVYVPDSNIYAFILYATASGSFAVDNVSNKYGMSGSLWLAKFTYASDFNGDGRDDLLVRHAVGSSSASTPQKVYLVSSSGSDGFISSEVTYVSGLSDIKWGNPQSFVDLGDFDGDGKADVLLRSGSGNIMYATAMLLRGSSSGSFEAGIDLTNQSGMSNLLWSHDYAVVSDINGDGKSDLMMRRSSGWGVSSTTMFFLISKGSDSGASAPGPVFETVQNVTGLFGLNAAIWTSASFSAGDFNGDGRSDMLVRRASSSSGPPAAYLLMANGISFNAAIDVSYTSGMTPSKWDLSDFRIGDYDGDGDHDIFVHSYKGSLSLPQFFLPSASSFGNLVVGVSNGFGGSTAVVYQPSSRWSNTNNPPKRPTVSITTSNDGRGVIGSTQYSYAGGAWDSKERRSLGFRYVKMLDPTGESTETYFYQGATFASGEVEEQRALDSVGGVVTRSYRTMSLPTGPTAPWDRRLSQQDDYECNGDTSCKVSTTNYSYDSYGNVTNLNEQGDPSSSGDERVTSIGYAFDASKYIVSFPATKIIKASPDASAPVLSRTNTYYDGGALGSIPGPGDATKVENWLGSELRFVATQATYDAKGNVLTTTDERGVVSQTAWITAWSILPSSTTNALGHIVSSQWDPVCRARTSLTDANNKVWAWQYDAFCRETLVTKPDLGTVASQYIAFGDANAQYIGKTSNDGYATTWSKIYFDGLGREWKSSNNVSDVVYRNYDSNGYLSSVSAPFSPGEVPKYTTFQYDSIGRLQVTTFPDGTLVRTLYGDWMRTTCDERGVPRSKFLDAYGRVRLVREFIGKACVLTPNFTIGVDAFDTNMTYDTLDQRVQVVDARGAVTNSVYDTLGRRVSRADPDAGLWRYEYDDAGNLLTQTSARGFVIKFVYDELNRVLRRWTPIPSGGCICLPPPPPPQGPTLLRQGPVANVTGGGVAYLATYNYDEAGHGASIGHQTSSESPSGSSSTTYDSMGRAISETNVIGTRSYTFSRVFDALGKVRSMTYPNGEVVSYGYDGFGRPTSISSSVLSSIVTSATYDARGHQITRTLGNGIVETRVFASDRNWLNSITAKLGSNTVQNIVYTRNATGDLVSRENTLVPSDSWAYAYDDFRRLTAATNVGNSSYSESFTYDPVGRITASTAGTYVYSPGGFPFHAPATIGGVPQSYDLDGNLIAAGSLSIAYNIESRASSANGIAMEYDADGQRVRSGSTYFVGKYVEDDLSQVNFYYLGDRRVASRQGGVVSYFHNDHLGTATITSDGAGAVVARQIVSPFGKRIEALAATKAALAGQRLEASGLYSMGARQMNPVSGLFVSPDPSAAADAEVPQSLNRFAYADNSPVNLIDPSGFAPEKPEKDEGFWYGTGAGIVDGAAVTATSMMIDGVNEAARPPFSQYIPGYRPWMTNLSMATVGQDIQPAPIFGLPKGQVAQIAYTKFGGPLFIAFSIVGMPKVAHSPKLGIPYPGPKPSRAALDIFGGALRERPALFPFNGPRLRMQLAAEQAAGIRMPDKVLDLSDHMIKQIASRDGGIGIDRAAINDAWNNPLKIEYAPDKYGAAFKITGRDATIVVNENGKIVTGYGTSAAGVPKK